MPDDLATVANLAQTIAANNKARFEQTLNGLSTYQGIAVSCIVPEDSGRVWLWQATGVANGDNIRAAHASKGGVWVRQVQPSTTGGNTGGGTVDTEARNLATDTQATLTLTSAMLRAGTAIVPTGATRIWDEHGSLRVRESITGDTNEGGVMFLVGGRTAEREEARNGPANVRWWGAKGDGSDDTVALQKAIAYARAKVSGTQLIASLYFPIGYYRYTQTLKFDFRVNVFGEFGFGNAVTLVYDPPASLVDTLTTSGGTVDPMSVPAILMTGTRTGGTTPASLGNGLRDGGTASLLYGSRVSGIQLSTTGAAVRKVDGLVWRDCSEVMWDQVNINGEFRHGVAYWGVSILFAHTVNASHCTNGIYTRSANATNWNIAAITAMHHHANIWRCDNAHHLTGSVRHFGVADSWQEYNQTHLRITATAKGITDLDDVVFSHAQMSNGDAGITPDSRMMIIDLTAVDNNDPNHGVVRVKNVTFRSVWGFLKESSKAFEIKRGAAGDVALGRITLDGVNVYGLADNATLFVSDALVKVSIGAGGLTALKDWLFPLTPLASLKNFPVTFLGWTENAGGVLDSTQPSGARTVSGRAVATYQNASLLLVHVDYPETRGLGGGAPAVTVSQQEAARYGGGTAESYKIPVAIEARNVTATGCDLAVFSVAAGGQFLTGDTATLAFRVDGMAP